MDQQARADLDAAHELGRDQLGAALVIATQGVRCRCLPRTLDLLDDEFHRDVAAGDPAVAHVARRRGRRELQPGGAHSTLDGATASSSSVNAWPISSSSASASAASASSIFDMAKPT